MRDNTQRHFGLTAYGGESELALIGTTLRLTSRQLFKLGDRLALETKKSGVKRMVLVSQPAEVILAALIAAQGSGADVVLIRHPWPGLESAIADWGVDGQIHQDLSVSRIETASDVIPGRKLVVTTSGTTGPPKAAVYSLDRLVGRIKSPPPDAPRARWLLTYVPASFAGLQVLLTALVSGATLCVPQRYEVNNIAEAAVALHPTHVSGTPTFWRGLLMALGGQAVRLPLKRITLGGEVADQAILDRLSLLYPQAGISHIYASTEAGAVFTVKDKCEGFPAKWLEGGVEDVELRINDRSVLEVRTRRGMEGYVGSGDLSNQWIVTGDVVQIKRDRVFFVGREDAVINVGGAKVWPESVEGVLCGVPGVAEAHVYGKRNPILGALVMADVVVEPGYDESEVVAVAKQILSAKLQRHAVPQRINPVSSITTSEANKKVRSR